jgi:hypothetical protein
MVADHLGSPQAAELWLDTVNLSIADETPRQLILMGKGEEVLAGLENLWGPAPCYN